MEKTTFTVVIPMAGLGTRLRPHTWSKPKQLVGVAGKTVLDHVLDTFKTLPGYESMQVINIVGYLGEQIEQYVHQRYPEMKSHFVVQEEPRGQSHAIELARQYIHGPTLVVFADTLIETDLGTLEHLDADAAVWVKAVPDPRRFGVAEIGPDGLVKGLVEKPQDLKNNLAIVGFYYFKHGEDLLTAIDEQIAENLKLKGEFYLADAVNIMLKHGLKMRALKVDVWLDAGTPEALLETNRYLLEHGLDNSASAAQREGVVIIPPVFLHPSARVSAAIIGPHASVGANCEVQNSIIQNTILEDEAHATGVILEGSLVGRCAEIKRRPAVINAGDNTEVSL